MQYLMLYIAREVLWYTFNQWAPGHRMLCYCIDIWHVTMRLATDYFIQGFSTLVLAINMICVRVETCSGHWNLQPGEIYNHCFALAMVNCDRGMNYEVPQVSKEAIKWSNEIQTKRMSASDPQGSFFSSNKKTVRCLD